MSVRKGIHLKSDAKISESFKNAPAQLFVAGPPSYRQFIGEYRRKTLTLTHSSEKVGYVLNWFGLSLKQIGCSVVSDLTC